MTTIIIHTVMAVNEHRLLKLALTLLGAYMSLSH